MQRKSQRFFIVALLLAGVAVTLSSFALLNWGQAAQLFPPVNVYHSAQNKTVEYAGPYEVFRFDRPTDSDCPLRVDVTSAWSNFGLVVDGNWMDTTRFDWGYGFAKVADGDDSFTIMVTDEADIAVTCDNVTVRVWSDSLHTLVVVVLMVSALTVLYCGMTLKHRLSPR